MTEQTTGAVDHGAQPDGLTDAEKLVALQAYMKALKPIEEQLRAAVTADLKARSVERVGAYLPDGEKLGTVGYRSGNKSARVTDSGAALAWCLRKYPQAIISSISPAFLKALTDAAVSGMPGEPGVDPSDGEMLPFIEVTRGAPGVTVTPTKEGVARMTQLAHGFAGMLEAPAAPAASVWVHDEGPATGAVERRDQSDKTARFGVGSFTPMVDEDYWTYRVRLSGRQAILGFPKFDTIGIGFAYEEDWNTNLPYSVSAAQIFEHIRHNKLDTDIRDEDVIAAIELVRQAAFEDRAL